MTSAYNFIEPIYIGRNIWIYKEVETFWREDGIEGVRAKEDIPENSAIEYSGKLLTNEDCSKLHKFQEKYKKSTLYDYILEINDKISVDAHPRYDTYNNIGGNGKYIAGKINEPNKDNEANMYPKIINDKAYLITNKVIKKGEELKWYYGKYYVRDYEVGYGAIKKDKKRKHHPYGTNVTVNDFVSKL